MACPVFNPFLPYKGARVNVAVTVVIPRNLFQLHLHTRTLKLHAHKIIYGFNAVRSPHKCARLTRVQPEPNTFRILFDEVPVTPRIDEAGLKEAFPLTLEEC